MGRPYNVYCDESCHLESDSSPVMVLGAVWCPSEKKRDISKRIKELKIRHGLPSHFEIKWNKVSIGKLAFYLDLIDYFFDDDDLHFRALIADKTQLDHKKYNQTHDDWYYKMYFDMLKVIISPQSSYNVFLDIKDSASAAKIKRLHEVLSNNVYDFSRKIIRTLQTVRSHEVSILQLADFLIGIVAYTNRNLLSSEAKLTLVNRMQERSRYSLTRNTLYKEEKVNLLKWQS